MTHAGAGVIRSGGRSLSRAELQSRAARAAAGFAAAGVERAGVIAVLMRNDIPFVETVLAARALGAYTVPINWHFTAEEINYILHDSGAAQLVIHADLLQALDGLRIEGIDVLCVRTPLEVRQAYGLEAASAKPSPLVPEWDAWVAAHEPRPREACDTGGTMIYTSGTTGRPKGVRRAPEQPGQRQANAELRQRWFGNRPGMRTAIIGPLYHSVQLTYAMAALSAPGEAILVPRFDAEGLLALVETEKLTHLQLVPIMMNRLVKLPRAVRERYDTSSLEFVVHGAAPCPPEVKRALIDWLGPIVHEHYGTTETGMICRCSSEEWLARPGTVGKAWPGREIRIYDSGGNVLAPGLEGEIYTSLGVMSDFTYHHADDERSQIERDGLIASGDVGYTDEEGYLYLCDRARDMVISGGVNVYPAETEAVLSGHPDVIDSAVFGVPDAEYGESLVAVVQLHDGASATAEELRRFARERLASYKVPRVVELRELPRDASGKIRKRGLRDAYWSAAGRRI
jgi:long-chain acyl-CoA synthetase